MNENETEMKSSSRRFLTPTRGVVAAVASVAVAGAVGLGAVTTGTVPVLADPVELDEPVQAPSFADIVEKVSPSVVSVRVKADRGSDEGGDGRPGSSFFDMPGFEDLPDDHPLKRFFDEFGEDRLGEDRRFPDRRGMRPSAQGSGFFISEDGYLVTNNHVIQGGDEYTVVMDDGTEIQAELIGSDPRTDLAVLKVDEEREFTYVAFSEEERVRVGDWVVAVGNPFGLGGTVTAGIISASGRDIGAGPYDDFIQIDAAVNRGNSGGPAFDLSGRVVGVNTAIFSPSGGNVGIAFAIPATVASDVVNQLIEHGDVDRGWLGVQIQPVNDDIAESLGLERERGALVSEAQPDSPASEAGIKAGDVVVAVDGEDIESPKALARLIGNLDPGQEVEVTLWRNGETEDVSLTLGELPAPDQLAAGPSMPDDEPAPQGESSLEDFGLTVTEAEDGEGLVVTDIEPGSPADERGLQPGDVILSVNAQEVSSTGDVGDAVAAAAEAGRRAVLVQIKRDDANRFLALPMNRG